MASSWETKGHELNHKAALAQQHLRNLQATNNSLDPDERFKVFLQIRLAREAARKAEEVFHSLIDQLSPDQVATLAGVPDA